MFINRDGELGALEERFRSNKPEFLPIYGRRRVGKTELIKQFCTGKRNVYLLGRTISEKEILDIFSSRIADAFGDEVLRKNPFGNWDGLFTYLAEKTKERIIIVFDEFPYLVRANKALPSILQAYWDEHFSKTKIFLILCGSSIGMMEKEVLTYKSPLYGRRTGQIFLEPLKFKDALQFFPRYGIGEKIEAYAVLGGTPAYLLEFDDRKGIMENIRENTLAKDRYLYHEIPFLLREELREPANYFSILKAISFGKTRLNEIVQSTGLERGTVARFIDILIDLRLVERRLPVTEKHLHKSRKGIYKVSDNFFNFWFRFIYPNKDYIEMGDIKITLEDITANLNQFTSPTFEEVSRELLRLRFPDYQKIGSWWYKDYEIDVVAINNQTREILFGECKWSNRKMGKDVYLQLLDKVGFVDWNKKDRKEHFALFSRSGFTASLKRIAEGEGVRLFDLKDFEMYF